MNAVHRGLLAMAGLLGGLAALVGSTSAPGESARDHDARVAPLRLAAWIKDRHPGLRVIDVRSAQEFDVFHLPAAESAPLSEPAVIEVDETSVVVLYAEEDEPLARLRVKVRGGEAGTGEVYVLRGGLNGWLSEVMNPVLLPDASSDEKADFQEASALSRYFGGVPRSLDPAEAAAYRAKKPSLASTRGRGC